MELERLIRILEISVKRNGEKPLTNKWLLNILKLTQAEIDKEADKLHQLEAECEYDAQDFGNK